LLAGVVVDHDLEFILYQVDYSSGKLIARSPQLRPDEDFSYRFEESSLATRVFRDRLALGVNDARNEAQDIVNLRGVTRFNITGPLYAGPVNVSGHTAAILVAWTPGWTSTDAKKIALARLAPERASRIANLMANDLREQGVSLAARFLTKLGEGLGRVDGNRPWNEVLRDGKSPSQPLEVLMSLLLDVGIKRIRAGKSTAVTAVPQGV
jgi:hypothetical protein